MCRGVTATVGTIVGGAVVKSMGGAAGEEVVCRLATVGLEAIGVLLPLPRKIPGRSRVTKTKMIAAPTTGNSHLVELALLGAEDFAALGVIAGAATVGASDPIEGADLPGETAINAATNSCALRKRWVGCFASTLVNALSALVCNPGTF